MLKRTVTYQAVVAATSHIEDGVTVDNIGVYVSESNSCDLIGTFLK